jgi:hypothetical protein
LSSIQRFSVRSSGRDLTQVRRPAAVKVQKAKAPKASPATDDRRAAVTHEQASEPKASPANKKADVKPDVPDE